MKLSILVIVIFLSACSTTSQKIDFVTPVGFQPVAPIDISEQFPDGIILLAEFPNDAVSVAVREVKQGVSIAYGPAILSSKGSTYEVKVDYIKYRTKKYDDSDEIVREGFGVRMIASVTTNEDNVDLGSLYALGVAAENSKLSGTLTMETMGISGETITPLIPIPSKIDVSTIQNVLQAAAAIKSKMYDESKGVTVRPQVLSFKPINVTGEVNILEASEEKNQEAVYIPDYSGNGWVYLGHLVNGTFAETATTNATTIPTVGTIYGVTKVVHVRNSYPVFPMYRLSNSLGTYQPDTKIKIVKQAKVGFNKIWAKVERQ